MPGKMGCGREVDLFPTREDVHGIKRLEVLREAAASFNFKGYHATSMNEIAASLGVTKAALYHYFPNKNQLLAACFEHAMDAAFASLERARKEGRNGRERLVGTISGYVAQLNNELNCCVVLMEEQALEPDDHAKLVRKRDRFERALRALVREGIEDGSVAPCDPKLAIFVILGAMNWVPKWFKPSGAWKSDQLNAALAQMFERLISSSPVAAMVRDVAELPARAEPPAGLIGLRRRERSPRMGQDRKIDRQIGRKIVKKIDKKIKTGGKR
jgi:TetR/AcrR family transcriptional regulator